MRACAPSRVHGLAHPFFAARTEAVFLNGNVRPVNLSLALLLGPFRSSQNGGPAISTDWPLAAAAAAADGASLYRWEARSSRSIGRSTLGDAKLSKGCCSLRSRISFRLQRRPRYSSPLSSFFFFFFCLFPFPPPPPPAPLLPLPRSNVYSVISSAVGEGRARNVRARQLTPIDFRLAVLESARSVRLFPLAYIAIRLCCEWQTRRGR